MSLRLVGSAVFVSLLLTGCGGGPRSQLITPGIGDRDVSWTEDEQQQIFIVKPSRTTAGTSTHVMRVTGRSDHRVHDRHDCTVVVLAGKMDVRLAGKWHTANAGEIIEIPRGSTYMFEAIGESAEAYLIYNPPYDGKDLRNVK